jgi:iron complex outermembrane receptor protein
LKAVLPALAACAAATSTFASEVPLTRGEPVVVTATRFEEPLADRPINMTVITREQIEASPSRTVPDILAEQSGIAIHDFFGNNASTTTVDLRGFGINGTQNTLILVDGRRVGDIDLSGVQWSAVPLSAVERIEIVRGGGSVLYGEGATAGVINIITRAPGPGTRLAVRGSAGNYGTREAGIDGSIAGESAAISIFANAFESSGYRENNHNRQTNGIADLRWKTAFGDFALKASTDSQGIRLPGARQVQPSTGVDQLATDRRGTSTPLDWAQRDSNRALLDWRHKLGAWELNVGGGWRDKTQKSYFDFSGFPDYREIDLSVWSLTPRAKLDMPLFGRPHTFIVGLDWYSWDYRLRRSNSTLSIARPFNTIDATEDTVGLYVLDTVRLTDALVVTAGGRRERLRIDASDFFDPGAPGGAFGSGAPPGSQRVYESAYEVGVRYEFAPQTAVTAKTTRSYRFANVDETYETSAAFTNQFQFLRPQTARTHELGVETRVSGVRGRAALFEIDVTNEIHLDPFTNGVGNRNLPPSRRRGVEVELGARPMARLGLAGTYTYIDARFREGVLAGDLFTQQNVIISGKTVPLVPRHKVGVRASWDFNPATRLSVLASYVSSQFMDNDEGNTLGVKIPSYSVVDMKLAHRRGPLTIAATVNNLFAEKYFNYAVRSQFVPDRYNTYPLPERSALLTVEYAIR